MADPRASAEVGAPDKLGAAVYLFVEGAAVKCADEADAKAQQAQKGGGVLLRFDKGGVVAVDKGVSRAMVKACWLAEKARAVKEAAPLEPVKEKAAKRGG